MGSPSCPQMTPPSEVADEPILCRFSNVSPLFALETRLNSQQRVLLREASALRTFCGYGNHLGWGGTWLAPPWGASPFGLRKPRHPDRVFCCLAFRRVGSCQRAAQPAAGPPKAGRLSLHHLFTCQDRSEATLRQARTPRNPPVADPGRRAERARVLYP